MGRIVSVQTSDERGGAEFANANLLAALRPRGNDVLLLTNMPDAAAGTDVPVTAIDLGPKLSRRSWARVIAQMPRTLWRLARALRAAAPVDVSLLHFKKEQLLFALLPKRLTGRVVWAEWGPVPPRLRGGPPRLLYALAGRRAAAVMAVSEGTRRTVVEAGVDAAKVEVVPNLVDVERIAFDSAARERVRAGWGAGPDTFVVGCISRFQRRKRNDVVIDAMAAVDGDVRLVLVGDGDEEAALRERAAGDARISFLPTQSDVAAFLSACDLLVFAPSPTEGAPRVIILAQLVGIPVVSTGPEGAEGLIPAGAGTICAPADDPSALARALAAYRDDPERRRREGAAARAATLASHDPERVLAAVERLLRGTPA
ncbi:MAG: glycosyltransferase [Solirubrobacterales bacterium]|nr:glycosyltransferase [Solirubrobacterales bacterium]